MYTLLPLAGAAALTYFCRGALWGGCALAFTLLSGFFYKVGNPLATPSFWLLKLLTGLEVLLFAWDCVLLD